MYYALTTLQTYVFRCIYHQQEGKCTLVNLEPIIRFIESCKGHAAYTRPILYRHGLQEKVWVIGWRRRRQWAQSLPAGQVEAIELSCACAASLSEVCRVPLTTPPPGRAGVPASKPASPSMVRVTGGGASVFLRTGQPCPSTPPSIFPC